MNSSAKFNYLKKPFKKFKLNKKSKLSDEIQEISIEDSDTIIEKFGEPSLTGLKGELETAVTQYLTQVKELGFYKETQKENTCQFTTFKTPALPKKTLKVNQTPDKEHLDVKFKLTNEPSTSESVESKDENAFSEFQGLDNPLYLSLSECSTGKLEDESKETFYENISNENSEHSDEDHIYENVETHLYDTVSNPPRPKLPPKPSHLANPSKATENTKIKRKSYSFSSQTKHEKYDINKEKTDKNPLKINENSSSKNKEVKAPILEGSETSDLGSSGSEDTVSEEDWPLPPLPLETEQTSEDIPLPPPPPEIALQQLDDEVTRIEGERKKNLLKEKSKEPEVSSSCELKEPDSADINKPITPIEKQLKTIKKRAAPPIPESNNKLETEEEPNLQLFRTESFGKKHLKSKLFTLNKGLSAYKKATKDKEGVSVLSKFVVVDDGDKNESEAPAVRHSVIIELKDSSVLPSSHQAETQIKERLETLKHKPELTSETKEENSNPEPQINSTVCLNVKQDCSSSEATNISKSFDDFNEQIIEISEDGTWEMKDSKTSSTMNSSSSAMSVDIDPFTGLPITLQSSIPDPVIIPSEIVKEYIEPDVYFEQKDLQADDSSAAEDSSLNNSMDNADPFTELSLEASASSISTSSTDFTSESQTKSEHVPSADLLEAIEDEENEKLDSMVESKISLREDMIGMVDITSNGEHNTQADCLKEVLDENKSQSPQTNLGAAIMEGYERDLRRKKEDLNLPEVSLLEFGDGVKDLEIQRKTVIEQMTVKAKRKDSWIRTFRSPVETSKEVKKEKKISTNNSNDKSIFSNKKMLFENKNVTSKDDQIQSTANFDLTKKGEGLEVKAALSATSSIKSEDGLKDEQDVKDIPNNESCHEKDINNENTFNQNIECETEHFVQEKNEMNKTKNQGTFLGKCLNRIQKDRVAEHNPKETVKQANTKKEKSCSQTEKGEVDSGSILTKKQETKAYWETKMLPVVDDVGWEPVANVKFRSEVHNNNNNNSNSNNMNNNVEEAESPSAVPPPPEFSASPSTITPFEALPPPMELLQSQTPTDTALPLGGLKNERPTRQYVYGAEDGTKPAKTSIQTTSRSPSHENIIEAEIREQQLREEALRKENDLRNRDKSGGASSPSSHTSDEGFVDRPILLEELPTSSSPPPSPPVSLPLTSHSTSEGGFTHTLKGHDGEPVIYDAVSPSPESFIDKTLNPCGGSSETKIALEIRELKEREAELRSLRELREREQELRSMRNCITQPRTNNPVECEEETEEEVERASSSSREGLDDHLTSLTTTTDEGNYSECGDPGSSEDKSSDGSNSRMMSPDLHSFGPSESRPRKVTVKPFEDDDNEPAEPVYTQMKKESVIEREIRLAREREEAFRREKGLSAPLPSSPKIAKTSPVTPPSQDDEVEVDKTSKIEPPKRGVQHHLATNRIQQEIEETAQRERELRKAGKIRTLSEDTVDSKVTRLSDIVFEQETCSTKTASSISSASSFSSLNSSPSRVTPVNGHTPLIKRTSSPVSYSPPCFNSSPNNRTNAPTRLTRSQSTNNLSFGGSPTGALRVPQKGLMQKFIASRGKMTGSAFAPSVSPSGTLNAPKAHSPATASGIPTRPMKISPKAPIIRREVESKVEPQPAKIYRRTHTTAEEKIQEELREMKKREEELRRLRARNLARSQPNLAGIDDEADMEDVTSSDGVDSSSFLHEMNGLRTALSNPNLLDEETEKTTLTPQVERGARRRSALIAQWEGRIQQTTET